MSTTGTTLIRFKGVDSVSTDQGTSLIKHLVEQNTEWPDGTASGSFEAIWSQSGTITKDAFLNLDLNDLDLLDSDSNVVKTISFTKVKAIYLRITGLATSVATLGGGTDGAAAADAWAGAGTPFPADASLATVQPDGVWVWENPAGGAVTNTSADIFCIGATVANVTYEIVIAGDIS